MVKKRLIGVIIVKDDWAVQSFSYSNYLPLGKPEVLVENLDRWGSDEILVISINRSREDQGPDFDLIRRLQLIDISTPLIYGGGIRTAEDAVKVIQTGAERVCFDALIHIDPDGVREASRILGSQAIIGLLPLAADDKKLLLFDYLNGVQTHLSQKHLSLFSESVISEVLITDWKHEGHPNSFDVALINLFPLLEIPIIAFGGISDPIQASILLDNPRIVAVGVGNFLSYREHAIQFMKNINSVPFLRPPKYYPH